MTTWSTATIKTSSNEVGGPKVVTGLISAVSGDTGGSLDLSSYFAKEIKHVLLQLRGSGTKSITSVDITTVKTTMTVVHSDPTAAMEISSEVRRW